jgi:hypothetical protein
VKNNRHCTNREITPALSSRRFAREECAFDTAWPAPIRAFIIAPQVART